MSFIISATDKAELQRTFQDWQNGSKTNNQYVTADKVSKAQDILKKYGVDFTNQDAIKNDPVVSKLYRDFMLLGQNVPTNLNDNINGGAPTDAINKQWEGAMNDLIATVYFAPTTDDTSTAVQKAMWDGSDDAKNVAKLLDAKKSGDTDLVNEAVSAYRSKLQDSNATPAEIGAAQRQVMLAWQVQYPDKKDVNEFKSYMRDVVGYTKDPVIDPQRKQDVTGTLDSMQYSDEAKSQTSNQ